MNGNIGFIGCGKMAQAMIGGMLDSGLVTRDQFFASAVSDQTKKKAAELFGINVTSKNTEVAQQADVLFLAVPPIGYAPVIEEIKESVKSSVIVVTIAAGVSILDVEEAFGGQGKVIRTMPNTPSLVGAGMSAMCASETVTAEELQSVVALFQSFGEVEIVLESQMDAIPAISGSSPAYVYMMIEALADGGVRQGLSRNQSYRLAAQAVMGAAKMVLDTDKHPGELKDQVCSPGGATIAAVSTLEQERFRGAILAAMDSCTAKVKELGKK